MPLVLKVVQHSQGSLRAGLDFLGTLGLFVDARFLRRWLAVLGVACERLRQHPLPGVHVEVVGGLREKAGEFARACRAWEASGNGPPDTMIMAWQQRWQMMLLAIRA